MNRNETMNRKKVLILGATGLFGSALTQKLTELDRYELTLSARHAADKYNDSKHIRVVNCNAENADELQALVKRQDVVYCAISGEVLPVVAKNLVSSDVNRLLFMGAVGIYNEIPIDMDGDDNLDNEPEQIPNRKAVDIIEASDMNYTVLRPGYLHDGDMNDFILTYKGELAKGYISTIPSVVEFAVKLIDDDSLYTRENVSITKDMRDESNETL
ncbi:MAG: NAD(P)H-binding protein [Oscillospiraceae bacterium]